MKSIIFSLFMFCFLSGLNSQNWESPYASLSNEMVTPISIFQKKKATLVAVTPKWAYGSLSSDLNRGDKSKINQLIKDYDLQLVIILLTRDVEKEVENSLLRTLFQEKNLVNHYALFDKSTGPNNKDGEIFGEIDATSFPYGYLVDNEGNVLDERLFFDFLKNESLIENLLTDTELKTDNSLLLGGSFDGNINNVAVLENNNCIISGTLLKAAWASHKHQFAFWQDKKWQTPEVIFDKDPTQFHVTPKGALLATGRFTHLVNPKTNEPINKIGSTVSLNNGQWQAFDTPNNANENIFFNGQNGDLFLTENLDGKTNFFKSENATWQEINFPFTGKARNLIDLTDGTLYLNGDFMVEDNKELEIEFKESFQNVNTRLPGIPNPISLIYWNGTKWKVVTQQTQVLDGALKTVVTLGIAPFKDEGIIILDLIIDSNYNSRFFKISSISNGKITEIPSPQTELEKKDVLIFSDQYGNAYLTVGTLKQGYSLYHFNNDNWTLLTNQIEGGILKDISFNPKTKELFIVGDFHTVNGIPGRIAKLFLE